ncbi:MAG: DUF4160 domain-containing protein [Bacteroidales bacterium]|nr:DUF4160 domain-containing protein [Bacteroidales bacterium]MBR2888508.1 DUF4160 domain-containing protein [Bacteroidales bacterium]
MPKIYEYLGIVIQFFSNEHNPIHIHATTDDAAVKVSFVIENGNITATIYEPLYGDFKKIKDLKKFIELFKDRLVNAWVDYFVYHKRIRFTKITTKL